MKIYHGTSFENACKILSCDEWAYPIEKYLLSEYNTCKELGIEFKHKEPCKEALGLYFTTNVNHAALYAKRFDKPVVLFYDNAEINDGCIDFMILDSIPTSKVKAVLLSDFKIGFYGGLVNALYGRAKYVSRLHYGGIVYGDSLEGLRTLLLKYINNLKELTDRNK